MAIQREEAGDLLNETRFLSSDASIFPLYSDEPTPDLVSKLSSEDIRDQHVSYTAIGKIATLATESEADIIVTSDTTISLSSGEIHLKGDSMFVFNALLSQFGKPKRPEELRALGFTDRQTSLKTITAFKYTISRLIEQVNQGAEKELIQKTGITKGTRYNFSEETKIADSRMSTLLIGENPSYIERERVVTELCRKFKDDPYVQQRLFGYRNFGYSTKSATVSNDELGSYLKEINRYRLLTKEDEIELFTQIEKGLECYVNLTSLNSLSEEDRQALLDLVAAREIVFNTNLRLAVTMSKRFWRVGGTLSEIDLIQEANCGLSQSIPRMKIEKGFKFSTYASTWIRQSVGRAVADKSREIRIPTHLHEKYVKAMRLVQELSTELGREPTDTEIEQHLKMPVNNYYDLLRHGKSRMVSLNKLIDQDGDTEIGDLIARTEFDYTDTDESFQQIGALKEIVKHSNLSERQLFIIAMRYGIYDLIPKGMKVMDKNKKVIDVDSVLAQQEPGKPINPRDLGDILNVSFERIRQIEQDAMRLLRQGAIKSEI
jgi:RNA polymerase sigma factor (sigma-70 family)